MWLFLAQYKKVIALCVIPVIAVVGLVTFEIKHGQSNVSKPLVVNQEMKALLKKQDSKVSATPIPTVTNSPEVTEIPLQYIQPEPSVQPKKTAEPMTTSKPIRSSTSKTASKSKKTENASLMVNLNTAKTEELMELSGIGESKAKAIISYREAHPFQTLDELMNVKGIGPKIFEKIKVHLEL
jgi:competence protein ComEA